MSELKVEALEKERVAAQESDRAWQEWSAEATAKAEWTPPPTIPPHLRKRAPVTEAFKEAKSQDSILAYQTFVEEYPDAPAQYRKAAERRLRELAVEKQRDDLRQAITEDSLSAYTTFWRSIPTHQPNVLGPVHVDTVGVVNLGSLLADVLDPPSRLEVAVRGERPKASPNQINELLKREALRMYGGSVHAVINATQQTRPDGNVFADRLAIQFTAPHIAKPPMAATPTSAISGGDIENKLRQLKRLLNEKLITPHDYEVRKAQLLREL